MVKETFHSRQKVRESRESESYKGPKKKTATNIKSSKQSALSKIKRGHHTSREPATLKGFEESQSGATSTTASS